MKKISYLLYRFILSIIIIVSLNMILNYCDFNLPINLFSILSYSFLGVFGLISFIVLYILV